VGEEANATAHHVPGVALGVGLRLLVVGGNGNTQCHYGRVVNPRPYHDGTQSSSGFTIDFQSMVIEPENG
jgi:hypothetical protein